MNASFAARADFADASADAGAVTLEGLEKLYREHFEYAWRSARRLGVRREEADDVVQETFLRIHRLLGSEEPQNVRGWLFAVLLRVVQHHRRAQHRRSTEDDGDTIESLTASIDDPETRAQVNETVRMVESVLDNIDAGKRAVLILSSLEEKTLPEIAEILGVNVNTVASRLRAARQELADGIAREQVRDRWRLR